MFGQLKSGKYSSDGRVKWKKIFVSCKDESVHSFSGLAPLKIE